MVAKKIIIIKKSEFKMKCKYPDQSVSVKDKKKCRCCLKPFENDTEPSGVTSKIAKQFNTLTNIEVSWATHVEDYVITQFFICSLKSKNPGCYVLLARN